MNTFYRLFFAGMFACTSAVFASQEWQESLQASRQQALLQFLYKTYDQCKGNFLSCLPQDVIFQEVKHVLQARKIVLEKELSSISYKNVFLSEGNMVRMGVIIAATVVKYSDVGRYNVMEPVGQFAFDTFNDKKLGLDYDTALMASWDMVMGGIGALQAISGFGLYKDIQAMRATKAQLTAELEKINKMLAVLEKAQ